MSDIGGPFEEMETVNLLLAEATDKGYVTYDQILEALPELENNLPLLETILEEMQAAGVSIYENEDDAEAGIGVADADEVSEGLNGAGLYEEEPHAAPSST